MKLDEAVALTTLFSSETSLPIVPRLLISRHASEFLLLRAFLVYKPPPLYAVTSDLASLIRVVATLGLYPLQVLPLRGAHHERTLIAHVNHVQFEHGCT